MAGVFPSFSPTWTQLFTTRKMVRYFSARLAAVAGDVGVVAAAIARMSPVESLDVADHEFRQEWHNS